MQTRPNLAVICQNHGLDNAPKYDSEIGRSIKAEVFEYTSKTELYDSKFVREILV